MVENSISKNKNSFGKRTHTHKLTCGFSSFSHNCFDVDVDFNNVFKDSTSSSNRDLFFQKNRKQKKRKKKEEKKKIYFLERVNKIIFEMKKKQLKKKLT